jgi:hypothetical protein
MPIDASIPLQGIHFDAGAAMERNMRIAQMREEMARTRRQDARDQEERSALAEYLLSQGRVSPQGGSALSGLVPTGGQQPQQPHSSLGSIVAGQGSFPQSGNPGSGYDSGNLNAPKNPRLSQVAEQMGREQPSRSAAYERAVRADPDAFLSFEGKRLNITGKQLESYRDLNDTAMQLLGGVYDQQSYDAAKARAHTLYASHGHDLNEMGLPDQYSPELVRSLQMQGMDTSKQLQAVARENKLNWDE